MRSGVATEPRKHTLKRPRGDTREATARTHARTLVTHSLSGHLPSTSLQANLPQLLQCRLEAPLQGTLGDCTWTAGALTAPTAQSATSCIAHPLMTDTASYPFRGLVRNRFIPVSYPASGPFHAVSYLSTAGPFHTVSYRFKLFHTRFKPRFISVSYPVSYPQTHCNNTLPFYAQGDLVDEDELLSSEELSEL